MENQFVALVAIEWADQEHGWAMEIAGQENYNPGYSPLLRVEPAFGLALGSSLPR